MHALQRSLKIGMEIAKKEREATTRCKYCHRPAAFIWLRWRGLKKVPICPICGVQLPLSARLIPIPDEEMAKW